MSQTAAAAPRPPMTLPLKLSYGFGSVAFGAKTYLMGQLLFFYSQLVGLPPIWVSVALTCSLVFDAFWDPFIGQISDNVRSRWGRRHPFMYASALPAAGFLVMLFHPPQGWSDPAVTAYMFCMVVLARCTISLYEVPATALTPELAPRYDERTGLLTYRYFFGALATSGAAVLGLRLFLTPIKGPNGRMLPGQMNEEGYAPFAIAVGVIMIASILIASIATHKFIPHLHIPPLRRPPMWETVKEMIATLSNRNFLVVTLSALMTGIGGGLGSGLSTYFSTFMWGLQSTDLSNIIIGSMLGSFLALLIAPVIGRRLGKKRGCITVLTLGLIIALAPLTLRLTGILPYSLNGTPTLLWLLFADRVLSATMTTCGGIMVASMIADVVEENQVKTGRRSEGLLLSADNVLQKVVGAVAGILPGVMIQIVGLPRGRHVDPASVDPSIMHNLALMYLPGAAAFSAFAIAALTLYRIDKNAHEANLERLREVAAAAETAAEGRDSGDLTDGVAPSPRPL